MSELHKLDRAISDLLMEDGRMSSAEIARRVGTSERSVRYRSDRLLHDLIVFDVFVDKLNMNRCIDYKDWPGIHPWCTPPTELRP